jgi:hypothetical protein
VQGERRKTNASLDPLAPYRRFSADAFLVVTYG